MSKKRFSKATVAEAIVDRRCILVDDYLGRTGRRIDPNNGTAQIPKGDTEAAYLYGQWRVLGMLFHELELEAPNA